MDASEPADDAQSQEESDAETIEKVIRHRTGRKGGEYFIHWLSMDYVIFISSVFINPLNTHTGRWENIQDKLFL